MPLSFPSRIPADQASGSTVSIYAFMRSNQLQDTDVYLSASRHTSSAMYSYIDDRRSE